jgi:hypothetical protein
LYEGFENQPVGTPPGYAKTIADSQKGADVVVTDALAAEGEQCLKVTDAAGLKHAHIPYFSYYPHHTRQSTYVAFDLRIEDGAAFFHEWRDRARPYHVGPHLEVADGVLHAGDIRVCQLPGSQWVHCEINASLGADAGGTWDLVVTLPDGRREEARNVPFEATAFKALNWLGFVSTAQTVSTFYLDNLVLEQRTCAPR